MPFLSTNIMIYCFLLEVKHMVELALTMKVKLTTNKHESEALNRLCDNYTSCCNEVSD